MLNRKGVMRDGEEEAADAHEEGRQEARLLIPRRAPAARRSYQPPLFEKPPAPREERIAKWAQMFGGNKKWVADHLDDAELHEKGKTGRDFTRCVRGRLWALWRERWRDEREQLERQRDRAAAAAAAKPKGPAPWSGNSKAAPVGNLIGGLLRDLRTRD